MYGQESRRALNYTSDDTDCSLGTRPICWTHSVNALADGPASPTTTTTTSISPPPIQTDSSRPGPCRASDNSLSNMGRVDKMTDRGVLLAQIWKTQSNCQNKQSQSYTIMIMLLHWLFPASNIFNTFLPFHHFLNWIKHDTNLHVLLRIISRYITHICCRSVQLCPEAFQAAPINNSLLEFFFLFFNN